ncbi:PIN domain-containing protein [Deinococcus sonorensis]|uniref:PIN domain-containing protein n=1 Tax=Deinococcus sonorensis TaxID=309891 RepID=A0ABV8Y865_9DEIO
MAVFTALYDANVLYPARLRDLLIRLAVTDLVQARWTTAIHAEWIRNVLRDRPDLTESQLQRTRTLMDTAVPDSLVTGYEPLIATLVLPDPADRHVLAAAIRGRADVIVTMNLQDFPAAALAPYSIEVQHPDVFIRRLLELDPATVMDVVRRQRADLKRPPLTVTELLDGLDHIGLTQTVNFLRAHQDML